MRLTSLLICTTSLVAAPALAEETRQLDAHAHGSGALNIAVEGDSIAVELEVPGFDLVGFEYEAKSDADTAAVEAALAILSDPLNIMAFPADAACTVTEAAVEIETDDDHEDDHGHDADHYDHDEDHADGDAHDDHDEDHAEGDAHDDHDEKHADGDEHDDHDEKHADGDAHDDHDGDHAEGEEHDDHDEEHADGDEHGDHDEEHAEGDDHDGHGHDDQAEGEESHNEYHAAYLVTCGDIAKVTSIDLTYFAQFENAEELEVQLVTDKGAFAMEASPDASTLDLSDAM